MALRARPVSSRSRPALSDRDARVGHVPSDDTLERMVEKQVDRVADLQKVFYADGRYALLVILQGRDASGKDGVIKKVFRDVNPQGVHVTAFRAPSEAEQLHDYLWRVHERMPPRGMFGVFNRSHYEEVLVPRVHGLIDRAEWTRRFRQINEFERMLAENRVVILKFFLHMSKKEQRTQLQERLEDPTKNWKFRESDLDDRKLWDEFTVAYRDLLVRCSTPWAPWYIIPADDKHVRNLFVARTIAERLAKLDLRYPRAPKRIRRLKITS
ncbi:MAG TPA: PPK2 family polyphosphate kinase [Gemmatimonadaceae bacterium]|nr:PPK2 family polyphosphate kinase [Gemmatimonadaceae bacterium]